MYIVEEAVLGLVEQRMVIEESVDEARSPGQRPLPRSGGLV
jgi:hypothetical protein